MDWLLLTLVVLVWIVGPFVLLPLWLASRARAQRLTESLEAQASATRAREAELDGIRSLRDLTVVRLEVTHRAALGQIEPERAQDLQRAIDDKASTVLAEDGLAAGLAVWQACREAGWDRLAAQAEEPLGAAPWARETTFVEIVPLPAERPAVIAGEAASTWTATPEMPPPYEPAAAPPEPPPPPLLVPPTPEAIDADRAPPATPIPVTEAHPSPADGLHAAADYALKPVAPGPLETALRAVARWPQALLPFLLQRLGWFIGAFLFLSGSIFLVAYTAGYTKALLVHVFVLAYTLFLVWAGYILRLRQPALTAASTTLLTLGYLLVPLNVAAGVRLIMTSAGAMGLAAAGWVASLVTLIVYLAVAQVVAGVMHRQLQGTHPRLYLALAAVQLLVPALAAWPQWWLLALGHLALLVVLAAGLVRYTKVWLQSVFEEGRGVAAFAAGSLLYAALVAFVHLTWSSTAITLPRGYLGPFTIVVAGLLFYLDAHLQPWAQREPVLSRFTFIAYGVALVALAAAHGSIPTLGITLAVAIPLFAALVGQYRSLVPLYLAFATAAELYWLVLLRQTPAEWHLVIALPGLVGLIAFARWIGPREARAAQAAPVALNTLRAALGLGSGLALWSAWHGAPSHLAAASLVMAAAIWWLVLGGVPGDLLGRPTVGPAATWDGRARDLRDGPWLYAVTIALALAVACLPLGADHISRLGPAWASLGLLWVLLAARLRERATSAATPAVEVLIDSALVALALGIVVAMGAMLHTASPGSILGLALSLAALATLRLSLALYAQPLFYVSLVFAAGAIVTFEYTRLHLHFATFILPLVALALWVVIRWLDGQPDEAAQLRRAREHGRGPRWVLWILDVQGRRAPAPSRVTTDRTGSSQPTSGS